jgi:hypothetical protein
MYAYGKGVASIGPFYNTNGFHLHEQACIWYVCLDRAFPGILKQQIKYGCSEKLEGYWNILGSTHWNHHSRIARLAGLRCSYIGSA